MAEVRLEIIVNGLVQGVGFRYFVLTKAIKLELKGYTKNLFSGEVLTIAEGEKYKLEELVKLIKSGPSHAHVKNFKIDWKDSTGEFKDFTVKY